MTKATRKQIRAYYVQQGYEVKITKDDHVAFRVPLRDALWKDGRYVSEYCIVDGKVVLS